MLISTNVKNQHPFESFKFIYQSFPTQPKEPKVISLYINKVKIQKKTTWWRYHPSYDGYVLSKAFVLTKIFKEYLLCNRQSTKKFPFEKKKYGKLKGGFCQWLILKPAKQLEKTFCREILCLYGEVLRSIFREILLCTFFFLYSCQSRL
jgi:hypothetical protein